ncbi:hypothetical protein QL285_073232 [Trifolium repens]|nr:hypothetical protein QL285_073232 [Trifolium repens]
MFLGIKHAPRGASSSTVSTPGTFPTCSPTSGTHVLLSLSIILASWNGSTRLGTCNGFPCIHADTWKLSGLGCSTQPNRVTVGHALGVYKYSSSLRSQVFYSLTSPLLLCTCTDLSVGAPAGTNPPPLISTVHDVQLAIDSTF